MNEQNNTLDGWGVGALLVWLFIFMMNLFPEAVFALLRELGHVVTMRAWINSFWIIPLASATYLGWFSFNRCLECDDPADVAFGKSVQLVLLAIAAFLPVRMEQLGLYMAIPIPFYRYLILSVVTVKWLAWIYLVSFLLRYYVLSGHKVFKDMPLLFPSTLFYEPPGGNATKKPEDE